MHPTETIAYSRSKPGPRPIFDGIVHGRSLLCLASLKRLPRSTMPFINNRTDTSKKTTTLASEYSWDDREFRIVDLNSPGFDPSPHRYRPGPFQVYEGANVILDSIRWADTDMNFSISVDSREKQPIRSMRSDP